MERASNAVLLEQRGAVAIVTLNLPHKRNAISAELHTQLTKMLQDLQDDASVRAIVLSGGRHFCAGGDLSVFDLSALEMRQAMHDGHRAVRVLTSGRLPVVAAVEGAAYGAGFSLALACDFVVADESASFCAAFARIGLAPDYGMLWTLPQRVGVAKAREILMFAEALDAARAHALGVIDRLVPKGTVLESSIAMAEQLAAAPVGSVTAIKYALARAPMPLDATLAWEADTQALLVCTEDVKEGAKAVKEKRPPQFKGR